MFATCKVAKYGLNSPHVYTLVGMIELKRYGRVVRRLVKLRNSFIGEKYNGPWNNHDEQWTS